MPKPYSKMGLGPHSLSNGLTIPLLSPSDTNATTKLISPQMPILFDKIADSAGALYGILPAVNDVPHAISIERVEDPDRSFTVRVLGGAAAGMPAAGHFVEDILYSGAVPSLSTGEYAAVLADGAGAFKLVKGGGVAAHVETGVVGSNNAIAWAGQTPGVAGNSITVALVDPAGNSQPLTVTVSGTAISVSLATGSGGAITSTAAQVMAAIRAHGAASRLVSVANYSTSSGAGVVAAVAATPLASGVAAGIGRVLRAATGKALVLF